jgi:hypothetical protein
LYRLCCGDGKRAEVDGARQIYVEHHANTAMDGNDTA